MKETNKKMDEKNKMVKQIGKKFDGDKPMWALLPLKAVEQIVIVLTYGAKKYGRENWKELDDFYYRYTSAIGRHWTKWQSGEPWDADFFKRYGIKVSHLAMIATNAIFLLWKEMEDSAPWTKK